MSRILACLIGIFLLASNCLGDSITLKNGTQISCKVMKATDERVFVRVGTSCMMYPRSFVSAIEIDKASGDQNAAALPRIPSGERFLDLFVAQKWVEDIRDVPATVIDTGVLKHVPYISYRYGDYEINVYGDPAKPAGIEVGLLKRLVDDKAAQRNALTFMLAALSKPEDKDVLKSLKLSEDKTILSGITFEVTPPTSEDAYGGWWISVYDEAQLEKSRASDEEIELITVKKDDIRKQARASQTKTKAPSSKPLEPVTIVVPTPPDAVWNDEDLRFSRPARQETPSSGGTVYVRGYYRKDGTYVRPHTRRR